MADSADAQTSIPTAPGTGASSSAPLALRRPWWRRKRWGLLALAALFVWWFVPPVWRLTSGPVEVTRWDKKRGKTQAVVGPTVKGWTSGKKISRHALNAIIAAEDGKFYQHHGIDWESTWTSMQTNLRKKRYVRGGSTLSQQVVKMAFLDRDKTLTRKAREGVGVLLMELILPKDKILEWYINLAEFGDGVYSVAEGSRHYFHTKPELLTIEQAVHLALVLPSPNAWSRGLRRRALTPFGQKRFAAILNNMRLSGAITRTQWASAVTRGDFGRPIAGYEKMLAAEDQNKLLCPGNPGCPEDGEEGSDFDEDQDELSFPDAAAKQPPVPAPPVPLASPAAPPAAGAAAAEPPPTATPQPPALDVPAVVPPALAPTPPPAAAPLDERAAVPADTVPTDAETPP